MTIDTIVTLRRGAPIQFCYSGAGRIPSVACARGVCLRDSTGKRYLEASSGPGITNIGHGNEAVLKAMTEQATKVCYASRFVLGNEPSRQLARRFVDLAGAGFDQAFPVGSGSEATEAAIKLARQCAVAREELDRKVILARDPGDHGATPGASTVTGDPQSDAMVEPIQADHAESARALAYRRPKGVTIEDHALDCARKLDEIIAEIGPANVLVFLMEPVGGLATGGLVAPDSYHGGDPRALNQARRAVDLRRGDERRRPHRHLPVGRALAGRAPGHGQARQGCRGGPHASGRGPRAEPYLRADRGVRRVSAWPHLFGEPAVPRRGRRGDRRNAAPRSDVDRHRDRRASDDRADGNRGPG